MVFVAPALIFQQLPPGIGPRLKPSPWPKPIACPPPFWDWPAKLWEDSSGRFHPFPVNEFFQPAARPPGVCHPQAEAEQIAALIDYLLGGGSHLSLEDDRLRYAVTDQASFKDIAILYRFMPWDRWPRSIFRPPASPVNWPGKLPAGIYRH